ncbi:MAG TPA: GGDEF domain-containing protein [Gammaproteobacteria bacterium]|nr:GGDEF domain-containing protein [Gammaproteobacteria bacterium]
MGKTIRHFALLCMGLLLCFQSCAHAAALAGDPPFTRFTSDLDIYPQNFAIVEDRDSIIYVGNYNGVLTFDGGHWTLIPLPNGLWVRSLAYDGSTRIYVGGYNQFGYIEHDDTGQAVFHDLTTAFKSLLHGEAFADIWGIQITPAGVLFHALQHLFLYDPASGEVRLWRYPGRFGAVGLYQGRTIAQFRGEGLKFLDHGRWRMMPGGEALAQHVYAYIPLSDGGLLMLSTDGRWLEYLDGRVRNFPVSRGFPPSSYFTDGLALSDGTLALTSADGNVYFMSQQGRLLRRIQIDDGALSGIIVGNGGGLLVSADLAVIHVAWPASWTTLGADQGLAGGLIRAVQWGSNWFVLSGAGVFETDSSNGGAAHFKRLNWSEHESWDLLPLNRDTGLLADSYVVMEIRAGHARPITHMHLYPRLLLRSGFDKNLVYVGTEAGLATLVDQSGHWQLKLDREDMNALEVTSMIEVAPHTIWIGSERGGVHLVKLSADDASIASDRHMGKAEGLDYGGDTESAGIFRLPNGEIIASTNAGEFRWQDGKFVADDFDGLEKMRVAGQRLTFFAAGGGLWAYDYNRVYHRASPDKGWRKEPINKIRHGAAIQTLTANTGGGIVLVSNHSILCYQPGAESEPLATTHTMLRSVLMSGADGTRSYLPLHATSPLQLPQSEFSLTFAFALPDYAMQDAVSYQARLLGLEPQFSDWSSSRQYTYSHLRPIEYKFEVRGVDGQGRVTNAIPFSFVVTPEWYASDWARAIWIALLVLLGIACAYGFVRLRTRRLARDKVLLEGMVAERTSELEAANRQLETMAHLDGLTGIANRRRLDDYLEQVWAQCMERERPLSLLVIDVDHFKDYNDQHGHLAGDRLLKKLVTILSRCLRRTEDLLARYGGEEFLVVLPGADQRAAHDLAEQMRAQVESTSLGATISVGIASCSPSSGMSVAILVNEADTALYQAKAAGRNRTVAAGRA